MWRDCVSSAYDPGGALDSLIGLESFLCPPLSESLRPFSLFHQADLSFVICLNLVLPLIISSLVAGSSIFSFFILSLPLTFFFSHLASLFLSFFCLLDYYPPFHPSIDLILQLSWKTACCNFTLLCTRDELPYHSLKLKPPSHAFLSFLRPHSPQRAFFNGHQVPQGTASPQDLIVCLNLFWLTVLFLKGALCSRGG